METTTEAPETPAESDGMHVELDAEASALLAAWRTPDADPPAEPAAETETDPEPEAEPPAEEPGQPASRAAEVDPHAGGPSL